MTSCKDAIKFFDSQQAAKDPPEPLHAECSIVRMTFIQPPIQKMDPGLKELAHVEQLSISTNQIERIANLNGFKNLKTLSIGRNNIKSFAGLEQVADSLENLWCSYCSIEKMKGIAVLKNLKVLYMTNNKVKDWKEFEALKDLPCLVELNFVGNPLEQKCQEDGDWVAQVQQRLPGLKKLDGIPLVGDDPEEDEEGGGD
eukprot:m.158363 g.158363  ORF g.158363 m.158363 type:complete len:199 (+) comp23694_c1_seq5:2483-3079(+)